MAKKKAVEVEVIERARKHLEKVPPKAPATRTLVEALEELKPTIESALERGYTRDEVVGMLVEKGLEVKPYHLKKLLQKPKA